MDLRFFEIYRNAEYVVLLAEGALVSAGLTLLAGIIGFGLASILASFRYFAVPICAQLSTAYVEFIRNTPLIVQLFFFAFGLPALLGYQWPFWAHALLALSINFSAYFSEIIRSGLQSVSHGQIEAARSLGLPPLVTLWRVLLPQAVAKMAPAIGAQFIFLFLTTGVISEIGVTDLTQAGLFIDSRTFRSFEVFLTLTAIYILISLVYKWLLLRLQRRLFRWQVVR
ncbi:MAG: amino acid ABC transporter permease [Pseudomonadota bacterium]